MNILLVGEYYSSNLGDGVICKVVEEILKKEHKANVDILDLSGENQFENEKKIKSINKENKKLQFKATKNIIKKILIPDIIRARKVLMQLDQQVKYDMVIFAGGQLFMDYFSITIYTLVKKLNSKGIPIAFNGCGLGRNKGIRKKLLKSALNKNNVKYIGVRDNISILKKEYVIKEEKVTESLDCALAVKKYFNINDFKGGKIGLGIATPKIIKENGMEFNEEMCLELWGNIIAYLEKNNKDWVFYTNGSLDDHNFAKEIAEKLGYENKLLKRPLTPKELVNMINTFQVVIAFRMHSHIISHALGKESIGFIWDNKIKEFFYSIEKEYAVIPIDNNIYENFEKQIENVFDKHRVNKVSDEKNIKKIQLQINECINNCIYK